MKIIIRNSRVNVSDVKIYNAPIKEDKEVNESITPDELNTEQAQALWKLAQEHGWVDEQWQPKGLSLTEASILADVFGETIHLKPRWKSFEQLWGVKNLKSRHQLALSQSKTGDLEIKIRKVFATADNQ